MYAKGVKKTVPSTRVRRDFLMPDTLWEVLAPLLPELSKPHRFGGGRPRVSDRSAMDAVFFVLRTGCQWSALDKTGICSSSVAHQRFQAWVAADVFSKMWTKGLLEYDHLKGIKWEWQSMDGAMTKSPLAGEKMWPKSHRPRKTRSKTKPPH